MEIMISKLCSMVLLRRIIPSIVGLIFLTSLHSSADAEVGTTLEWTESTPQWKELRGNESELYLSYVEDPHRSDTLVILFMSSEEKEDTCSKVCQQETKQQFYDLHSLVSKQNTEAVSPRFIVLDADVVPQKVFDAHGVTSIAIPSIAFAYPASNDLLLKDVVELTTSRHRKVEFMSRALSHFASITVQSANAAQTWIMIKLFGVVYAGGIAYYGIWNHRKRIWAWATAPHGIPWVVLTLGVLWIALSGSIFTFIRGMPPFAMQSNGIYLLHPASNSQFGLEGMVMGSMYFVFSGGLYVLFYALPYAKNQNQRNDTIILCCVVLFVSLYVLVSAFRYKNPWYRFIG